MPLESLWIIKNCVQFTSKFNKCRIYIVDFKTHILYWTSVCRWLKLRVHNLWIFGERERESLRQPAKYLSAIIAGILQSSRILEELILWSARIFLACKLWCVTLARVFLLNEESSEVLADRAAAQLAIRFKSFRCLPNRQCWTMRERCSHSIIQMQAASPQALSRVLLMTLHSPPLRYLLAPPCSLPCGE